MPALVLYVTGGSVRAERAEQQLRALLGGLDEVSLDVVDVRTDPGAAEEAAILATPTVVRTDVPLRVIGDLGDGQRVLSALGLNGQPVARAEEVRSA